jgi:hypothetical protein
MARSGESFAFGRQYDPKDTIVCVYDGGWYSEACYNNKIAQGMSSAAAKADPACRLGCQN